MTTFTWLAAATSLLTFCVHAFVGGRKAARPLLADQTMPLASKWLNYYCWHVTTVLLVFYVAGFSWLARHPHLPSLIFLGSLSFTLSILSAGVAWLAKIQPWRFPSTSLFAVIGGLSALAALQA